MPLDFIPKKGKKRNKSQIQKYCMGLSNIFAYPRFRRIEGSLGTDGMINRSRKMITPLKSQRAYSNPQKFGTRV